MTQPFDPPFPSTVFLDTVSMCNARCPFCPLFHGEDVMHPDVHPSGYMHPDLFERIIAELAALPSRPAVVYLGYLGESLLDRHFESRVDVIMRHRFSAPIDVLTNASFLDESKARVIAKAGLGKITIGFDGATKATYEQHRVRCNYEQVLSNIKRFARIRNELGSRTRIIIQYVRTNQNVHEVRAAYELFSEFLTPGQDYFQDNISKDWASPPLVTGDLVCMHAPPHRGQHGYCPRFATELIVHSDGRMGACCWDYNLEIGGSLGDLNQQPALALWRGPGRAKVDAAMRAPDLSDKPAKCQQCVFLYNAGNVPLSAAVITDYQRIQSNPYALIYQFPALASTDAASQV